MGIDKIACSSRVVADTDTMIITRTKRIGARAALSPLNLTPIGSRYADNKSTSRQTRQDETLSLYNCKLNNLLNLPNAYHP